MSELERKFIPEELPPPAIPTWLADLVAAGGEHYTCTGNLTLENGRDPQLSNIPYSVLLPLIVDRMGRYPADPGELIIAAEQVIRGT